MLLLRHPINSRLLTVKFSESKVIHGFSAEQEVGHPNPHVVQRSTVLRDRFSVLMMSECNFEKATSYKI